MIIQHLRGRVECSLYGSDPSVSVPTDRYVADDVPVPVGFTLIHTVTVDVRVLPPQWDAKPLSAPVNRYVQAALEVIKPRTPPTATSCYQTCVLDGRVVNVTWRACALGAHKFDWGLEVGAE